ncbi:MAG: TIGR03986 family CRISPR-associated RAMP protein [Bacteroidales bacterium]|nr:TIGR03986 family CRISPR-associated RAMP protein [Bacteroidales bacterium]
MPTIKAPFNFVPVSDKVFFPDWADQISHDIPFKDGESGVIELKITAESPVFVRNGHTKKESEIYKSFSKIDNKYFIPATSIKGAIRNVLEIMSFGKMTQVENDSFGIRDLNSTEYRNLMKNQHCGWLQYVNGKYMLTDCGEPGRISLETVDIKFGTNLAEFVRNRDNFRRDSGRTAKAKYETIGHRLYKENFTEDMEMISIMTEANPVDRRKFVKFGGNQSGTLVLTGQPGVRQQRRDERWFGKFYEFVFFDVETSPLEVDENIIRAFKTVHKNSPDFSDYWCPKLNKGEKIPVFFQYINDGGRNQLHSIGLSYLYKYPYKKSVHEAIPHDLKNNKNRPDLADCIFGYTGKDNSLKGRVQFSAAFSDNAEQDTDKIFILGSPKASYYPLYIRQDSLNGYNTYDNGEISGWKRYMVRKNVWGTKTEYNPSLDTIIHPVKKGSIFTGKIRFHNLKKVELGALLSALTFHNSDECYHQFGQGKPYGFGKTKVEIKLSDDIEKQKLELMALFEDAISKDIKQQWCNSEQMKELFTMAKEEVNIDDAFKYMHMDNDRSKNDFLSAKRFNEFLQTYSVLINKKFAPETLLEDIEKQRKIKYDDLIKEAESLFNEQRYNESLELFEKAKEIMPERREHGDRIKDIQNVIEQKKREELRQQQTEQAEENRRRENQISLSDKLKTITKIPTLIGNLKTWMKLNGIEFLADEELIVLKEKLQSIIQAMRERDRKGWNDFQKWRDLSDIIGEENVREILRYIFNQ